MRVFVFLFFFWGWGGGGGSVENIKCPCIPILSSLRAEYYNREMRVTRLLRSYEGILK